MQPMTKRIGLQLPNFTFGVPDNQMFDTVAGLATSAEAAGVDSVWVMDHFYQLPALGGADQPILEAYTLLGALAARTERVQLGTLVTGVTYRNPAMLAKIVTTLDVISKGRAILGIGAAWHDIEHWGLGFEFPPVKERMDRLEEAVQICRQMFDADHTTFAGTHSSTSDVRNLPRPIQARIPIMIGGGGEKRTLKLVAQYADACNIAGDEATIAHKIGVLRGHCEAIGRDPGEVSVTRMAALFRTTSDEETRQTREFIVGQAGEDYAAGFDIGTDDEILARMARLADAGVDEFILMLPFATPAQVGELTPFIDEIRKL
jgi:F420-dependent oxidoreductase-like protein